MEIWGKYTVNTIYIILVAHFSASFWIVFWAEFEARINYRDIQERCWEAAPIAGRARTDDCCILLYRIGEAKRCQHMPWILVFLYGPGAFWQWHRNPTASSTSGPRARRAQWNRHFRRTWKRGWQRRRMPRCLWPCWVPRPKDMRRIWIEVMKFHMVSLI